MDGNQIFDKVADLICAQLPVTKDNVTMDSKLLDELGADSANIMILVFDIESEFGIQVDNDALADVVTVRDIVEYIEKNI